MGAAFHIERAARQHAPIKRYIPDSVRHREPARGFDTATAADTSHRCRAPTLRSFVPL